MKRATHVNELSGGDKPRRPLPERKPPIRQRVFREEIQQQLRDLLAARQSGMYTVGYEVFALPDLAIGFAWRRAVGPEIRPPLENRRTRVALPPIHRVYYP